jgi:hypothetical protein
MSRRRHRIYEFFSYASSASKPTAIHTATMRFVLSTPELYGGQYDWPPDFLDPEPDGNRRTVRCFGYVASHEQFSGVDAIQDALHKELATSGVKVTLCVERIWDFEKQRFD